MIEIRPQYPSKTHDFKKGAKGLIIVFELFQFNFNEAIRTIVVVNDVVFKTETPETTQDIKIDRKKPNVSWEYLAGIISIEPCNVSFFI